MSCRAFLPECMTTWPTSQAQGVLSRWPGPSVGDVKRAYRKDTSQCDHTISPYVWKYCPAKSKHGFRVGQGKYGLVFAFRI